MKELIQGYLSHKNTWSAKTQKLTKTAVATVNVHILLCNFISGHFESRR